MRSGGGGVQGGVEQCRMHAEGGGVSLQLVGKSDLGEDFPVASPRGAQPLEQRPVRQARRCQILVDLPDVDRVRALRRPFIQSGGCLCRAGAEEPTGVPGPVGVRGGVLRPRVHGDRASARLLLRRSHGHLHLHPAVFRQDQRRFDDQLFQGVVADLVTGADRQFYECRTWNHDRPVHNMISQPWMCPQRQASREQEPVDVGQSYRRAEQRMPSRPQTERGEVPGRR